MYIALCDDRREELDVLCALLERWQLQRHGTLRYKRYRNAAGMLSCMRRADKP